MEAQPASKMLCFVTQRTEFIKKKNVLRKQHPPPEYCRPNRNSDQYSHCLLYGRYGITPTMLLAEEVLHAYAIISNSIMLLFTSLFKNIKIFDRTPNQEQKYEKN
jgi:hypothetical protein